MTLSSRTVNVLTLIPPPVEPEPAPTNISTMNLNTGVDPQNLQIGSTLCIPYPTASSTSPSMQAPSTAPTLPVVSCPNGAFSYTIQSGDTLWRLSQAYGVSVQSIMKSNC